jgi:hypothetical protein
MEGSEERINLESFREKNCSHGQGVVERSREGEERTVSKGVCEEKRWLLEVERGRKCEAYVAGSGLKTGKMRRMPFLAPGSEDLDDQDEWRSAILGGDGVVIAPHPLQAELSERSRPAAVLIQEKRNCSLSTLKPFWTDRESYHGRFDESANVSEEFQQCLGPGGSILPSNASLRGDKPLVHALLGHIPWILQRGVLNSMWLIRP